MSKRNRGSPNRNMARGGNLLVPDKRLIGPEGQRMALGEEPERLKLPFVPAPDRMVCEILLRQGGALAVFGTAADVAAGVWSCEEIVDGRACRARFDRPLAPDIQVDVYIWPEQVAAVSGVGTHRDYWYARWGIDFAKIKAAGLEYFFAEGPEDTEPEGGGPTLQ